MFYFGVRPILGKRNSSSHNNGMLTRWLIRCQLDELRVENVCVCLRDRQEVREEERERYKVANKLKMKMK